MKIAFLLHNVYGVGGTIRTTVNLAETLADRGHDVRIVSVFRHRDTPMFAVDPRVRVTPLVDLRTEAAGSDVGHPLLAEPARDFPKEEKRHGQYSRLSDERIKAWLTGPEAAASGAIVGTRPGLNVMLCRFGPRRAVRVAARST